MRDSSINPAKITIESRRPVGIHRNTVYVRGSVRTAAEKSKVEQIVKRHVGDNLDLSIELTVEDS